MKTKLILVLLFLTLPLYAQTTFSGVVGISGVVEVGTPTPTVPTPDAHYSMNLDGGAGTTLTADIGDNGTLVNAPTWVSDDAGGFALDFNGTNQSVNAGTGHDGLNDFVVAACIQPAGYGSSGGLGHIFAKSLSAGTQVSWALRMNDFGGAQDRFGALVQNDAGAADQFSGPIDSMDPYVGTATWVHVAAVISGCSGMTCAMTLYLNGSAVTTAQEGTDATGTRRADASDVLRIGGITGVGAFFDGIIDEVKLWYTNIPNAGELAADAAPCAARN